MDPVAALKRVAYLMERERAEARRATAFRKAARRLEDLDPQELERRLRGRGTDADDVIARRLGVARAEMSEAPWFDYLVVNDDVDAAVERLLAVIAAERLRRSRSSILDTLGIPARG